MPLSLCFSSLFWLSQYQLRWFELTRLSNTSMYFIAHAPELEVMTVFFWSLLQPLAHQEALLSLLKNVLKPSTSLSLH